MTKLAAYEDGEGRRYKKMTQYFRHDYVSMELIKSILTGTISFALLVGLWGVYSMSELINSINSIDYVALGTEILLYYLVFMAVYLVATYIIYNIRYTEGRSKIKSFYNQLRKVNRLYEEENHSDKTGGHR